MIIRVLHVFSPDFKRRFGGPIFDWQFAFSHWNDPKVQHLILDHEKNIVIEADEAFDFEISSLQIITSKIKRAFWVFSLIRNLSRFRADYDVIHFHILWWAGLLAADWAKKNGIPALYQAVLLNEDSPTGVLSQPLGKLKLALLKRFMMILALSEPIRLDYLRYGFPENQVVTLMNSVNTELFKPVYSLQEKESLRRELGLPIQSKILLFTGSLIKRKGVDLLVQAFIKMANIFPDIHLLLVGPKDIHENPSLDPTFVNWVKQLITSSDLSEKVIFWGLEKERLTLSKLYQSCDIFVFPSRNEGLGNVVLEAMASGLPVIVSDLPVLRGVAEHMKNSLVVPCEDVAPIEIAITNLMNEPTLASELAKNARDYVINHHPFSKWEDTLSLTYLNVFQDLLND